MKTEPHLFVWRGNIRFNRIDETAFEPYPSPYNHIDKKDRDGQQTAAGICPFCNIALSERIKQVEFNITRRFGHQEISGICNVCGFTRIRQVFTDTSLADESDRMMGIDADRYRIEDTLSSIQNYGINDERLHLREIGSHLRDHYADICNHS